MVGHTRDVPLVTKCIGDAAGFLAVLVFRESVE